MDGALAAVLLFLRGKNLRAWSFYLSKGRIWHPILWIQLVSGNFSICRQSHRSDLWTSCLCPVCWLPPVKKFNLHFYFCFKWAGFTSKPFFKCSVLKWQMTNVIYNCVGISAYSFVIAKFLKSRNSAILYIVSGFQVTSEIQGWDSPNSTTSFFF